MRKQFTDSIGVDEGSAWTDSDALGAGEEKDAGEIEGIAPPPFYPTSSEKDLEEEAKGPLHVFKEADEITRLQVLKKIFDKKKQNELIDIYKEEEASQAELAEAEDDDGVTDPISKKDYFLLKYVKNHPEVLEQEKEAIAEALDIE